MTQPANHELIALPEGVKDFGARVFPEKRALFDGADCTARTVDEAISMMRDGAA